MKLEVYAREECLRQAVDITKAYAQSGENKHGTVTEFLEGVYRKLIELKEDAVGHEGEPRSHQGHKASASL